MDHSLPPIQSAHLFAELDARLLDLLRSLTPDEWQRPTVAGVWTVKHVAAHLLDTALRRLTLCRDGGLPAGGSPSSDAELLTLVNSLNAQGVQVFARLSPPLLISLMEVATRQLSDYLLSLDPGGKAAFPVTWAGERESANWFDIARELTERWHHQQQIRLAAGKPGIMTPRLYAPVLDCFMRALPYALGSVDAEPGVVVEVTIAGASGNTWKAQRGPDQWGFIEANHPSRVTTRVIIPEEIAWRVFTKGIDRAEALRQITIEGDQALAHAVLRMVAIIG